MIVKKVALLGLASVATLGMSISMAGGPAACAPAAQVSGIYVGADVGAFHNNTYKFDHLLPNGTHNHNMGGVTITAATQSSTQRVPWGWTASGLIGYQFDNFWALQFGYIWNQTQQLNATATATQVTDQVTVTAEKITFKLNTYNLYLAVKGMLPLWNDFSAYMMVGSAWTHLKQKETAAITTSFNGNTSENFWSPMGALGVAWHLDEAFSVNLQYMYLMPDMHTTSPVDIRMAYKGTQRATVGVNYLFAV